MWPLRLCHYLLLIFLIFIFPFVSFFIIRIFLTVINEAIIFVTVLRVVFFIIRKVVLFDVSVNFIFHVLGFFPFFDKTDNNTDNALSEIRVDVMEDFLIKKFMILKEKFHFIFWVLLLKFIFDHNKFLHKSEKYEFEIFSFSGF